MANIGVRIQVVELVEKAGTHVRNEDADRAVLALEAALAVARVWQHEEHQTRMSQSSRAAGERTR
jgi:hypothetical protein